MQTTITISNGTPFTMSLDRDVEKHVYVLTFASQRRSVPKTEVHTFQDFTTAWEHYSNNMHYYNNVRPEPLTEEEFLHLPKGALYRGAYHA